MRCAKRGFQSNNKLSQRKELLGLLMVQDALILVWIAVLAIHRLVIRLNNLNLSNLLDLTDFNHCLFSLGIDF